MSEEYERIESEIRSCKLLLAETDYKALKYSEGLISDEDYEEIKSYRSLLRTKINTYEEQLSLLDE